MVHAIFTLISLFVIASAGVLAQDMCPGTLLPCNTCVTGSTVGRMNDHDCGEGHVGPDVVYRFVLTGPTDITLIGEADFDADWTLASSCGSVASDLGCFDWLDPQMNPSCGSLTHMPYGYLNFSTSLAAGTYYVWIDGFYSDSAGNYSLELVCGSAPTPVPTATPMPGGPGDDCSNSIDISMMINSGTYPQTMGGDLMSFNDDYALASCSFNGADGPDLVYSFIPDMDRTLTFDLCTEGGSLADGILSVRYDGACPGSMELACDDDGCTNPATDLHPALPCQLYQQGVTYYLFVDSYNGDTIGTYTLTIDGCSIPVCAPDSLAGQNPHLPADFWNALVSDQSTAEDLKVWDSFSTGASSMVCGVQWWGFLLEDTGTDWVTCTKDVDYRIEFYADSAGQPGTLLDSQIVTPMRHDTGISYTGYPLFQFNADLVPCLNVSVGWISIQAVESMAAPDCWFLWMSSSDGDGECYQWNGMHLMMNMVDTAFCLTGYMTTPTPGPTSTPAPPTSTPTMMPSTPPTATPTMMPSAPPNDMCPGTMIDCNSCMVGSTVGAMNDHDCGEGHAGPDVVYHFMVEQDTTITLIGEADFDADWTLSSACDDISGDLGCFDWTEPHIDPSCGSINHAAYSYFSISTFVTAGTYYLWVDGFYSDSVGNYAIELLCDTFPTPTPTATAPPMGPGDDCSTAIDISVEINAGTYPQTVDGDSSLVDNDYALASCSFNEADGPDLVYSFTPDSTRMLTFDLCSSGGMMEDGVLYVRYDGPCPGLLELTCDDDGCTDPMTDLQPVLPCREYSAGVTYYLYVDSYSDSMPGAFTITIDSCAVPMCASNALVGQNPHLPEDFWYANVSDQSSTDNLQTYDNLPNGLSASICDVRWWGFILENIGTEWIACEKDIDYSISFYQDAGGLPGSLIDSRTVMPQRQDTGMFYSGYPLYEFVATLDPCIDVSGGWLSVQAAESATSPNCWFLWVSSPAGDGHCYQRDGANWTQEPYDMGVCLTGFMPTATPTATIIPTNTPTPTFTSIPPTNTPTFTPIPPTNTPAFTPIPPTNTPTITPIPPTNTPTNTAVPPTNTPSFTATATAVPATHTPTSTATSTPTSTAIPVCTTLGVQIMMPDAYYSAGAECYLDVQICNPGSPLSNTPLFVVLDAYGQYYFYPSWCAYPETCGSGDFELLESVATGMTTSRIISAFTWPSGVGSADGLFFYSAMVDLGAGTLIGEMGTFEFSYGM